MPRPVLQYFTVIRLLILVVAASVGNFPGFGLLGSLCDPHAVASATKASIFG